MHLSERRGRDRLPIEARERLGDPYAKLACDDFLDLLVRKRLHVVLKPGERLEVRLRQQVRSRRQELTQLDERRTHGLEVVGKLIRRCCFRRGRWKLFPAE